MMIDRLKTMLTYGFSPFYWGGLGALNPVRAVQSVAKVVAPVARVAASVATAPARATLAATKAAVNGGSIGGAVTHTAIGNTTVLKVGQVAGAATAVYLTAGAAGAALGAAGASAATVGAVSTGAMAGLGMSAGGQLLMQGYIAPTAMAKAGVQGAVTGAFGGVQSDAINWATSSSEAAKTAYSTYQNVKTLQTLKDAKAAYDKAKADGQLLKSQQAELDALNAEIAAIQAKPLAPRESLAISNQTGAPVAVVQAAAMTNTTTPAAKPSPLPLVAAGAVALKLLAFL